MENLKLGLRYLGWMIRIKGLFVFDFFVEDYDEIKFFRYNFALI